MFEYPVLVAARKNWPAEGTANLPTQAEFTLLNLAPCLLLNPEQGATDEWAKGPAKSLPGGPVRQAPA